MIEKIDTYESRRGVERGTLRTIHRVIYRCSICGKMFGLKEEAEVHKHSETSEGDK